MCESLYSTLKFIKSKYQSKLPDEHLIELVQTALPNFHLDLKKKLIEKMNTQKSTSHK